MKKILFLLLFLGTFCYADAQTELTFIDQSTGDEYELYSHLTKGSACFGGTVDIDKLFLRKKTGVSVPDQQIHFAKGYIGGGASATISKITIEDGLVVVYWNSSGTDMKQKYLFNNGSLLKLEE